MKLRLARSGVLTIILIGGAAALSACSRQTPPPQKEDAEQQALLRADPEGDYGAGVLLRDGRNVAELLAAAADLEGRIVQVVGTVAEVCPRRGCWLELAGADESRLRVKVADGDIVFPLSAKGHEAVVEGVLQKLELDVEQHRAWRSHLAEEKGEAFDAASVQGPATIYQIQGLGARIAAK